MFMYPVEYDGDFIVVDIGNIVVVAGAEVVTVLVVEKSVVLDDAVDILVANDNSIDDEAVVNNSSNDDGDWDCDSWWSWFWCWEYIDEDVTDGSILSVVVRRDRLFKPYKLLLLVCISFLVFVSFPCFTIFIAFGDVGNSILVLRNSTTSGFDDDNDVTVVVVVSSSATSVAGVELLPNFVERYDVALLKLLLFLLLSLSLFCL